MSVRVTHSPVLGLQVVSYKVIEDPRGDFIIPLEMSAMEAAGLVLNGPVRQINVSKSNEAYTTRGIHVNSNGKLIFVPEAKDSFTVVVVDLDDPDGDKFGVWEMLALSQGEALYIPPGYGNAIQADTSDAVLVYALDADFDAAAERVVSLADQAFGIEWPHEPLNVSGKDLAGMSLLAYAVERSGQ